MRQIHSGRPAAGAVHPAKVRMIELNEPYNEQEKKLTEQQQNKLIKLKNVAV